MSQQRASREKAPVRHASDPRPPCEPQRIEGRNKKRDDARIWPRDRTRISNPLLVPFAITIIDERAGLAYDVSVSHTPIFSSENPPTVHSRPGFSTVTIPFLSEEHAQIVKQVLDVDRELQPHAVKRVLEVQGNDLVAFVPP